MRQMSILIMGVFLFAKFELGLCHWNSPENYLEGGDSDFGEELDEGYLPEVSVSLTNTRAATRDCSSKESCAWEGASPRCSCTKKECRNFGNDCEEKRHNYYHKTHFELVRLGNCKQWELKEPPQEGNCSGPMFCVLPKGRPQCACNRWKCYNFLHGCELSRHNDCVYDSLRLTHQGFCSESELIKAPKRDYCSGSMSDICFGQKGKPQCACTKTKCFNFKYLCEITYNDECKNDKVQLIHNGYCTGSELAAQHFLGDSNR